LTCDDKLSKGGNFEAQAVSADLLIRAAPE
jgi:hypothetical protein